MTSPGKRGSSGHRTGTVLLLVLVVVVILSLAGFSFTAYTYTEHKAARLQGDLLESEQAVQSAEAYLLRLIELSPAQQQQLGGLEDAPDRFRDLSIADRSADSKQDTPHFTVLSPRIESGQLTGLRYGLLDTSSKLNLARVRQWELAVPDSGKQALLQLPNMTEALADALLDWIDPDDQPRPFGAEMEFYANLESPYRPRNDLPKALEELLLVRGMTRLVLFGADENFNYQVDPYEELSMAQEATTSPSGVQLPLSYFLTTHSAEGNLRADGRPRIWLNDPDLAQLHERLRQALDESIANFVIAYRQFGPNADTAGVVGPIATGASGVNAGATVPSPINARRVRDAAGNRGTTGGSLGGPEASLGGSGSFYFTSPLDMAGAVVSGTDSRGRPATWVSPYRDDPGQVSSWLENWLDLVTVDSESRQIGRVNVNLAPREVLLAVPGLSDSLVEQIISMREGRRATEESGGRHATWLWTEGLVSLDEMKQLYPELTGQGGVWEAQVVGFWPEGGSAARVFMVLDGTTRPARRLYWKDLRFHGTGYSLQVLSRELPGSPVPSP